MPRSVTQCARRTEQIRHVANRRMRPIHRVQLVAHTGQLRKSPVQTWRDNGDGMSACAKPTNRLVWIAVASQVGRQEEVPDEQDRLTRGQGVAPCSQWLVPEAHAARRRKSARRALLVASSAALWRARSSCDGGGRWYMRSTQW